MTLSHSSTEPGLLDTIREQRPELGFALYAIEPGQDVTLEVISPDGQIVTYRGVSEQAVLDLAFPAVPPPGLFD